MALECSPVSSTAPPCPPSTERVDCPYCYHPYTRADADENGMIYCKCGGDLDIVRMKANWAY